MAKGLQKKLQEAVRKLSYRTSVDQLKQRGISKVNVVGLDRIVALVETAVHRTLRARLQGFRGIEGLGPNAESGTIAEATREEFLRLLRSNEKLEQVHQEVQAEKDELENEIDMMRLELLELRKAVAERQEKVEMEERIRAAETDADLFAELEKIFTEAGRADLFPGVQEILSRRLDSELHLLTESRKAEHRGEVELLERRIEKLTSTLTSTEQQLLTALNTTQVEQGISSIYREVQGISEKDVFFQKKKGLMASIFEANLALHDEIKKAPETGS